MRAVEIVRRVAPRALPNYLTAFEQGDALLAEHQINSPLRLAHFLAQILHESGGLRLEWENMNYSAQRLVEVFRAKHSAKVMAEEAKTLAHNQALIAERVYGLGNPAKAKELGNKKPGDGFRYRGGGLMQTTGRANYSTVGTRCKVPFAASPDLIVSAEHALKPGLIEWTRSKLNAFADADQILPISRANNLGNPSSKRTPNEMDDRKAWFKKVRPLCDGFVLAEGGSSRGRRTDRDRPVNPSTSCRPRSGKARRPHSRRYLISRADSLPCNSISARWTESPDR